MRSIISLVLGVAIAALAIVPAALGEGRLAGSPEQDAVAYFYANERATLGSQAVTGGVSRPDSHEIAPPVSTTPTVLHGEDHALAVSRSVPTSTPSTNSDDELAWPQLGIGFGLGILLAAGLWLTFRTRFGPVAH